MSGVGMGGDGKGLSEAYQTGGRKDLRAEVARDRRGDRIGREREIVMVVNIYVQ